MMDNKVHAEVSKDCNIEIWDTAMHESPKIRLAHGDPFLTQTSQNLELRCTPTGYISINYIQEWLAWNAIIKFPTLFQPMLQIFI